MISGVYSIIHRATGKVYVGSTRDIDARWAGHRSDLTLERHHSVLLQRAWLKYGAEAFDFAIVELVCGDAELLAREQFHMNAAGCCNPTKGFNVNPVAGSVRGLKWSKESRKRKSDQHKSIGVNSACRAASTSLATPERMRALQAASTAARYRDGKIKGPRQRWRNTPENRAAHIERLAAMRRGKRAA